MKKAMFLGLGIASTVIGASLLIPVSAYGADCPVSLRGTNGGGFGDRIHLKNTSDRPVESAILHLTVLNAVGEEIKPDQNDPFASFNAASSRIDQTFMDSKGLPPGQEKAVSDNLRVNYIKPDKGNKWVIYLRAVKFTDGSVWKDDGSRACQVGK